MKDKENLAQLREICDVTHEITKEDKSYLKELAKQYNVDINACKGCPNKWADLAVELYSKIKHDAEPEAGEHYQLKEGVDVIYGGVRVNEANITDEFAEQLIARGFPRRFFAHIPEKDAD